MLLSHILNKVKGFDNLLKEMKINFSSLNCKVNSHVDAIKIIERQLNLLLAQLTSKTMMNGNEGRMTIVTRSGKVAIGNMKENEDP